MEIIISGNKFQICKATAEQMADNNMEMFKLPSNVSIKDIETAFNENERNNDNKAENNPQEDLYRLQNANTNNEDLEKERERLLNDFYKLEAEKKAAALRTEVENKKKVSDKKENVEKVEEKEKRDNKEKTKPAIHIFGVIIYISCLTLFLYLWVGVNRKIMGYNGIDLYTVLSAFLYIVLVCAVVKSYKKRHKIHPKNKMLFERFMLFVFFIFIACNFLFFHTTFNDKWLKVHQNWNELDKSFKEKQVEIMDKLGILFKGIDVEK